MNISCNIKKLKHQFVNVIKLFWKSFQSSNMCCCKAITYENLPKIPPGFVRCSFYSLFSGAVDTRSEFAQRRLVRSYVHRHIKMSPYHKVGNLNRAKFSSSPKGKLGPV